MKKLIAGLVGFCMAIGIGSMLSAAEMKVSSDIEIFYERSKEIKGVDDDDRFKANQLYFTFDGKFENNVSATLKIDGADMVSKDGGNVTEHFIEDANFTFKHIAGSPLTLVFGKDEMPFGLDYDKYLNDSVTHSFEIDKVWGLHAICDIANVGNIAAAIYENRNGSDENETSDNVTVRAMVDKLVKGLKCQASFAIEEYEPASDTVEDEMRWSVGASFDFIEAANVNLEYTGFANRKGMEDYDPFVICFGVEYKIQAYKVYARYEYLDADDMDDGEENFYMAGGSYDVTKNFTVALEAANFNSANLKDAADVYVDEDDIEMAVIAGVHAKW